MSNKVTWKGSSLKIKLILIKILGTFKKGEKFAYVIRASKQTNSNYLYVNVN